MHSSRRGSTVWTALAVVVALLAVAATTWSGYEQRRHNRLSVLPVLVFEKVYVDDPSHPFVGLYLTNSGVGVARDVNLSFDLEMPVPEGLSQAELNQVLETSGPAAALARVIRALLPESPSMVVLPEMSGVLPVGEAKCILGIPEYNKEWVSVCEAVLSSYTRIVVTYRSVYGETFSRPL